MTSTETLLGPPHVRRRLAALADAPLNFDPAVLERAAPKDGWHVTDLCQPLPDEAPGPPVENGSWVIARALMRGYEFADPSIVRAYYDPGVPLAQHTMLLKLQAFGIVHLYVGVRVSEVYEDTRTLGRRRARVGGWNYQTLEGHIEMGQMDWQVWKWLDTGAVEFRVHSISRTAHIPNPIIRLGFWLVRSRERSAFLESTKRRMRTFTELALAEERDATADRRCRRRPRAAPWPAMPTRPSGSPIPSTTRPGGSSCSSAFRVPSRRDFRSSSSRIDRRWSRSPPGQ
jgi:hypothetical protein